MHMQLVDMTFSGLYQRGVLLEQMKEPALSRTIKEMPNTPQQIEGMEPADCLENITPRQIISFAQAAGIIDETDGRPLSEKLERMKGKEPTVLVDAIDDEPYVSSQMGPMLALREECAKGFRLAQKAVNSSDGAILVYKNVTDIELSIPRAIEGIPIKKIGGKYPAQTRIKDELGLNDKNESKYLFIGACALIHLCRAVYEGRRQNTAFVTVAGNCIGYPRNVEAPLKTSILDLIKQCGLAENPTRIILGGPITGASIRDIHTAEVHVCTGAVLVIRDDRRDYMYECIGCGRCTSACPQGLNPMQILRELRRGDYASAERLGLWECSHCMCCSYICPSRQSVAGEILLYESEREGGTPSI